MAQSYVQVPVDGAGKRIDAWVTAVATQYRQAIVIGDPDTDANIVAISSRLRLPVELEQLFDFDSGAGSATGSGVGIMIPASGGPVIAGIATQPFFVRLSDGSAAIATLPVSIAGTVTVTGGLTDTQLRATPVPVSGSVTANAGTNLNTSALALEAGGNLASILAVEGATTGAKVITDANGTIQQYLRGLIYLFITSGAALVTAVISAGTAFIGKLLPPDIDITTHTNYIKKYYTNSGAVTDGIIWSPASGKRWHAHHISINVSAACTVTLEDDLAGGDSAVYKAEFAANSGVVLPFPEKYPLASGEDAADLIITTTAGNVYVTVTGYEI